MISESDAAYAAGQIDADGSIMITKASGKYAMSRVCLYSQDEAMLEWMTYTFGGSYYAGKNRACYVWKPKDISGFINLILPYLKTKRDQALLVVEYREWTGANRKGSKKNHGDEADGIRQSFISRSKSLNARVSSRYKELNLA